MVKELTVNGITDTVSGWAKRNHLSTNTIYGRLKIGYSDEDAVEPSNDAEYKRRLVREKWHGRWVYQVNGRRTA